MYNVQIYQVISPQTAGGTRYGIPVLAQTVPNAVYTGFVPLDTYDPFVLTKISACFSSTGSYPGFVLPLSWEFRIWDEVSGRQLFQANVNGIDDGFIPFSAFSTQSPIGQTVNQVLRTGQSTVMSNRFYQLPEECEFPAGGLLRVDVRPRLLTGDAAAIDVGTIYVSFVGFSHD